MTGTAKPRRVNMTPGFARGGRTIMTARAIGRRVKSTVVGKSDGKPIAGDMTGITFQVGV